MKKFLNFLLFSSSVIECLFDLNNRRTPKKVKFEDEKKVEENKVKKATVPKEPSFMRPSRKRKIEKIENARGEKSAKKENEAKSGPRSVTQPKPFSFTTRTRKTKSVSEDEKKDVKKFKATCSQFTKPAAKRVIFMIRYKKLFFNFELFLNFNSFLAENDPGAAFLVHDSRRREGEKTKGGGNF